MKRIFFIVAVFISLAASAQTPTGTKTRFPATWLQYRDTASATAADTLCLFVQPITGKLYYHGRPGTPWLDFGTTTGSGFINNQYGSTLSLQSNSKAWVDTMKAGVFSVHKVITQSPHKSFLLNTNVDAGSPRYFKVDSLGNAGIGVSETDTLFQKLEVIGNVVSTGLQYTVGNMPQQNSWNAVASALDGPWKGMSVAVAGDGLSRVAYTTDAGKSWVGVTVPDGQWTGIHYANGLWVATGISGLYRVMTSSDPTRSDMWIPRTAPAHQYYSVDFFPRANEWIAVGIDSLHHIITAPPEGFPWTERATPGLEGNHFLGVTHNDSVLLINANTGSMGTRIATSTDNRTFTPQTYPVNNKWASRSKWYNGLFYVASSSPTEDSSGHKVMTSPNGIDWTLQSTPDGNWTGISAGEGVVVFVGTDGKIMTTTDGVHYKLRDNPVTNSLVGVTYNNGRFISVGISGTYRLITSGKQTEILSPVGNKLFSDLSVHAGVNANSLSVTGNADIGSLSVTGAIYAGTLSASITTPNQPSITTVGTLTNLTVTNNIQSATISSTITSATQLNITRLGTLSNLTVSGNISGNRVALSNDIVIGGTSPTPGYKADVNGNLRVSGIIAGAGSVSIYGNAASSTVPFVVDVDGKASTTASITGGTIVKSGGTSSQFLMADGSVTTATGGTAFASGTYTPTISNQINISSSTIYDCQYMRVGSTVTVSGRVDIIPTSNTTSTQLKITLPVASNLNNDFDCAGVGSAQVSSATVLSIQADGVNDKAAFSFVSQNTSSNFFFFTFTYKVI